MEHSMSFRQFPVSLLLGEAFIAQRGRHFDKADNLYKHILSLDPTNFKALHFSGLIRLERGDFEGAIQFITKALDSGPDDVAAWVNLSAALYRAGRIGDAVDAATKAILLAPETAQAYYIRGNAKIALGLQAESVADFRSALENDGSLTSEERQNRLAKLEQLASAVTE